jgi:hypothetical protein
MYSTGQLFKLAFIPTDPIQIHVHYFNGNTHCVTCLFYTDITMPNTSPSRNLMNLIMVRMNLWMTKRST